MRVLVTGASGQLGAALAAALFARGDEVRCLLRRPGEPGLLGDLPVERVAGDVTAPESLAAAVEGQEAVLHCAGIVGYWEAQRAELFRVNVGGTQNLLDAAARAGVRRFVFTSSIAACGYVEGDGEGDERTPFNWQGFSVPYADAKREAERIALEDRRLEAVILRPGIIWGGGDVNLNGGRLLFQLRNGQMRRAPRGGTTMAVLRDVVAGHLSALDRGRPGGVWVLGGTNGRFYDIVGRIARVIGADPPSGLWPNWLLYGVSYAQTALAALTGREPSVPLGLVHFSVRNRRYTSALAERELGYRATPLEEGVSECLAWYRANGRWG